MNVFKSIFTLFALLFLTVDVSAQKPVVHAKFNPDTVLIGDRFSLDVEVEKDVMQIVEFPTFDKGVLGDGIEIVSESTPDTVSQDGRTIKLRKSYQLTCFDAGDYRTGRYPALYVDKNIVDTIWSVDSLKIVVTTFEIDTLTQTIHDIKLPLQTPLRFGEISGYIFGGLAVALAIAAGIYYLRRYLRRRKGLLPEKNIYEPPHVAAIRLLEQLHSQKLWQRGKTKQYYTGITDILRQYIEDRYRINAMEMTSSEILAEMKRLTVTDHAVGRLSEILLPADYVKFAKYEPDAEQNELAYTSAYYFIEETKQIDNIPYPEEGGEQ